MKDSLKSRFGFEKDEWLVRPRALFTKRIKRRSPRVRATTGLAGTPSRVDERRSTCE